MANTAVKASAAEGMLSKLAAASPARQAAVAAARAADRLAGVAKLPARRPVSARLSQTCKGADGTGQSSAPGTAGSETAAAAAAAGPEAVEGVRAASNGAG